MNILDCRNFCFNIQILEKLFVVQAVSENYVEQFPERVKEAACGSFTIGQQAMMKVGC
jgi:hypothetical protein